MPIDLLTENPNPFFDQARISRAINDPRKNFLKTIWQKGKPVLDAELNEREDIDNFLRRQIAVLLAGEITVVEGLCPEQSLIPNKLYLSEGEIIVRGWDLIVEKNEGGFPTVDQNFSVVVIDTSGPVPVETKFPLNGLGFSPNISFDQPVGDNNTTIIHSGTFYDTLKRQLCVELENTCSLGPIKYRVETLDGAYSETATISPQSRHTFCLNERLTNCVTLPVGPSVGAGNRTDTIYLQVGEVEICSTVSFVKRNGHISHPESVPSNIFDPVIGQETSRRTQIQFDIRSCAGGCPEAPKGFYIYPLFEVLRRPGQPHIKLEDVTAKVPMIDLTKSGLFELIVEGAGITHTTILDIDDAGVVTPPTATLVVGSTIHIRNCGPANTRTFSLYDETFTLKVGESACVNFDKTGDFNLVDADFGTILATISIIGWGGGGISASEIERIRCAIGEHYFTSSGPIHPCDDSDTPAIGTEQSLDIRVEGLVFDMFEMALCLAGASVPGSLRLTYLFVDTFKTLDMITPAAQSLILAGGAFDSANNSIVVA